MEQLIYAVEDIRRLRWASFGAGGGGAVVAGGMKKAGELPAGLVLRSPSDGLPSYPSAGWSSSAQAPIGNDGLTLPRRRGRAPAVSLPLDVYVEAPDDFGGFIRHYEVRRWCAPCRCKSAGHCTPNIYPSGLHLEAAAIATARAGSARLSPWT
jgi:hypothetical protein